MNSPWPNFRKPRAPIILHNGALRLDGWAGGNFLYFGTDGSGNIGSKPLPRQLVAYVVNQNSASSAASKALENGRTAGTGEEGKSVRVPWNCSVVELWLRANVIAYTSGDWAAKLRYNNAPGASFSGGTGGDLVVGNNAGTKATGNNEWSISSFAAGTYPLTAGSNVLMYRYITSGALETDELVGGIVFQLDDPTS